ncbi:MAG: 2-isopropylmalate synthase [Campylobacterales bacterium]|nr:2-isopropylmalate synthase [Campylobacterales bacterium]
MDNIKIFDTTLRDGEQSPGASMTIPEKVKIARKLDLLGVDIIEAGFAVASNGDFEAVKEIAGVAQNSTICSLARTVEKDIETAARAIENAKKRRIHTFIATSPIHMDLKLKMAPDEVIKRAVKAVEFAKSFTDDVEFSCEDATRSEMGFLKDILSAVVEAGATTLNMPDTVGYATPNQYGSFIKELVEHVGNKAILSVHCHNDLGLAVANSLSAVENGARQIECTINGLGERAGNAALEEIVMALKTRSDYYNGLDTNIKTKEIYGTSRLVATVCGIEPQPNKAIVGKNAFSHESGIHQDGVLKNAITYEIMKPSDVGIENNTLTLGKLSGSHAFKDKLESLGYVLDEEQFKEAFEKFKDLADKKKEIYDDDIRALANSQDEIEKVYELVKLQISDCSEGVPTAAVTIKKEAMEYTDAAIGDGTIDAIFKVIDRVSGFNGHLKDYKVKAVTEGKDALARVFIKVEFEEGLAVMGHGLHIDTMIASANAYIDSLNNYLQIKQKD